MKPGTGGGSSAGPDCGAGCPTLAPCDPAELMALGVSVPFGTFVRPLEVNDRRDLWDFEPSSADSCSLSEKQFFTCSWALVETLTIGHKVTMQAELPIMSWVTSDPSSPNRMCTAEIHYQVEVVPKLAVLKVQKKISSKKLLKHLWFLLPLQCHLFPSHTTASWGMLYGHLNEEEKTRA